MNKFSFELSFVISKVFVADFEHVFVCWGRYRITIAVLRIIINLTLQTKPYSKSTTETLNKMLNLLRVNSRDRVSLLTYCLCLRLCLSVFLVYYEHVFVMFFYDVFIVYFKKISHALIYLFCYHL